MARARVAVALAAVVLSGGCTAVTQQGPGGVSPKGVEKASPPRTTPPPVLGLRTTPADGAKNVEPAKPIQVAATRGHLTSVKLTNPAGYKVKGKMDPAKASWSSAEPLGYSKTYTLTATGVGDDGRKRTQKSTFTTVSPTSQADLEIAVGDGQKAGVGMPISIQFSAPIADKKAVEKMIKIRTSKPTTGAFHWFSDTWAVWRPKKYWTPGTRVSVKADVYAKNMGKGVYGASDQSKHFSIGPKVTMVADGKKETMVVRKNGKKVRTIPISMGKPGHETPKGTYTVMSEAHNYTMDSSTYGVPSDAPGGYRTKIDFAARMSSSGIFYHSAPWSVGQQGYVNVSHGCINMSTGNAAWLMDNESNPGDIIEVRNSGGPELEATDGWGFWQLPWKKWVSGGVS